MIKYDKIWYLVIVNTDMGDYEYLNDGKRFHYEIVNSIDEVKKICERLRNDTDDSCGEAVLRDKLYVNWFVEVFQIIDKVANEDWMHQDKKQLFFVDDSYSK